MYVREAKLGHIHWPLVACVFVIAGLGVWNLGSAGRHEPGTVWLQQLRFLGVGTVLAGLSLAIDYRSFQKLAVPAYALSLVLLVLVPLTGREIMGARRWLEFGSLRIQPSEFAKFSVALMLARHFAEHPAPVRTVTDRPLPVRLWEGLAHAVASWRARRRGRLAPPPRPAPSARRQVTGYGLSQLGVPGLYLVVPVLLVVKQPDLGTGLVILAVGGSIILFAGLTRGTLGTLAASGAAFGWVAWNRFLHDYQKARVMNFIHPDADTQKTGYHAHQSLIAVGSGQVWGKGWGEGTQNQLAFLPEQHTDFAFPVWAEEHGFVGAALVVLLYLLLVLLALEVAATARDRFGAYLSYGAAALFFWHAVVNVGMVTGVLPVVGVPLLLLSYGGSSAVLTLLFLGALVNVRMRRAGS
jgi:rod shape determining protein RodA